MPSPRRKHLALVAVTAAAVALTVLSSPVAQADPTHPVFPSQQSVDAAKQKAEDAAKSVTQIKASLAAADDQLQQLNVAADQAANAYDGAVYHWQLASKAAAAAKARAAHALATAASSRSMLAGYVVSHDLPASELAIISSAMTAKGPTELINQMAEQDATAAALDAHYQTWQASSRLARVYQAQAARALAAANTAKADAAVAKNSAIASVQSQQAQVATVNAQKTQLIADLAKDEDISVTMAKARAAGLERLREERLAAERRAAELARERAAAAAAAARRAQERREHQGQGTSPGQPTPPSNPGTPPSQPNPPSGGASTAIAFAHAQVGDPYVWGAAGPDAWDCSGLTMGSWDAAGYYLPHYSVAQYADIEHISFDQLEPGDLVFWGTSSDPNSIYHVAIYIGDDLIIQAPHPGAYVEVSSIYDWILPNFFGRV